MNLISITRKIRFEGYLSNMSGVIFWILGTMLTLISDASGQLMMRPENTAGVVGSTVVLECQGTVAAPDRGIYWYEYLTSTARTTIFKNGDIVPDAPNSQLYSITGDSSVSQYHLNIELAFSSGGRYECFDADGGVQASSHVTVLQSAPVCSNTIQADGIVQEGEMITYTCEVNYNSTSIDWPPVMTWTGPDGAITDVIKLSTSGMTVTTSVNVTGAPGLNGAVYSVRTHFEAYGGSLPADHPTNVPTYSHSHSFNALQVHYSPRDIAFKPDGNMFNPGDQLTCSAVSNPAVSYRWYNSTENSTLDDGAVLTIIEEMDGLTCGCEAYNTIRGTRRSMSKEITLSVTKAPTSTSTTTASTPATSPQGPAATTPGSSTDGLSSGAVIGIAVGASLAALLIIAAVIYCCCCHDRKETPPTTPKNVPPVTMSKIHGDQVRMQADNGQALGPEAAYPQEPPPGYQTWDKSTPQGSYDQNLPPPDRQNPSAEGVVYADLALDDTPRSRKPIQVFENTDYAEIQRV